VFAQEGYRSFYSGDEFVTNDVPHSHLASVNVNGIEIVYDTFGVSSASPILLIADLGEQLIAWDERFCAQLAARGYWVIRFDNRDAGLSTTFGDAAVPDVPALYQAMAQEDSVPSLYTLTDMANDALGLLAALEISSANVVGFSMGGMIAQILTIRHSETVRTLTSFNATTGDPKLPLPKPVALSVLQKPPPSDRVGYIKSAIQAARVLTGPRFPVDQGYVRELAGQVFDRGLNPGGAARQLAAIISSGSRKETLQSVIVPTLVIHGDADPVFPIQCGIATARMVPGARITVIEGLGHHFPPAAWPQVIDAIDKHAI
jgi:pimeloyl-ACP methyl ester carboxylesterase